MSETKRTISPDDVIKSLGYCSVEGGKCEKCAFSGGFGCIDRLMLAAAELLRYFCKPGLWETYEDEMFETVYKCPACGEEFTLFDGTLDDYRYRHCPNCGKRLVEPKEDNHES